MNKINFSALTDTVDLESQNDPCFDVPSRMGIYGPSQSGKSTLILQLLKHRETVYAKKFQKFFYCLPQNKAESRTKFISELREICGEIILCEGFPDLDEHYMKNEAEAKLVIFDDLSTSLINNKYFYELLTQDSHHFNISVIYTSQNFFEKSREHGHGLAKQISIKIVFNDKSDKTVLKSIGRKSFNDQNYLVKAMSEVVTFFPEDRCHYLVIGKLSNYFTRKKSIFLLLRN